MTRYSLSCAPSDTQAKGSVRFAVIGDSGSGERLQYETADRLRLAHQQFPFEFALMLGDNIYGGKTPRDFERKFELPYKPLLDNKVTFYASLGNHDVPEEQSYQLFNAVSGASFDEILAFWRSRT